MPQGAAMGLSQHGFLILCYTLSVFVLVAFFCYALVYSYIVRRKNSSVENVITARGQVGTCVSCGLCGGAAGCGCRRRTRSPRVRVGVRA